MSDFGERILTVSGIVAGGLGLLALAAGGAEIKGDYLLQTRNTTMAFCRDGADWRLVHYGEKLENPASARALAFSVKGHLIDSGVRRQATYSVFGSDGVFEHKDPNRWGGLAVTHADGVVSTELKADKAETVADGSGATHLVFSYRDTVYPFFVTQHFRAFEDCDIVETWVELRNGEPAAVKIPRMDSLALFLPLAANDFYVQSMTGEWDAEGALVETRVGRGQIVSLQSRTGVRSAIGNNPTFMVSFGEPAGENSGRVLAGALAWSGAWEINLHHDAADGFEVTAGAACVNGAYVLDTNRALALPKVILSFGEKGKGPVSRNFHRWALRHQMPDGLAPRPVYENSWCGCLLDIDERKLLAMMDDAKARGSEKFLIDDGWFGGKYARVTDDRGLGDWFVDTNKFPRGIEYVALEANKRGLKFGLWVEPEMANTKSEFYTEHPGWVLQEKTRPLRHGRGGTQVVVDLANPAAREAVYRMMDRLFTSVPHLEGIKWDANADILNMGSPFLPADRQANLWFDYTAGLYDLAGRLRESHPGVRIYACASGGGRNDYGFLKFADMLQMSDNPDAVARLFQQWGLSHFFPPGIMHSNVTDVPIWPTGRSPSLKYRVDVAFMARPAFAFAPGKMSAKDIAYTHAALEDYKRLRPVIQFGNFYRLVSPWTHRYAAAMSVSEDRSAAVVYLYALTRPANQLYVPPLRLEGLDPDADYRVGEINVRGSGHIDLGGLPSVEGRALMGMGLPVWLRTDFDSAVLELQRIEKKAKL